MIDLNVIEQAARKPWYCRSQQEDDLLSPAVLELVTRLRQAEKDAERYRFMKEWGQSHSLNVYRKELWDEVIDREINNESRRIMKSSNGGDL